MGKTPLATAIVAAVEDPDRPGPAWDVACDVAARTRLPMRSLHVEVDPGDGIEALVDAIVAEVDPESLIVVATEHASRWSGKYSVAERLVDHRSGLTVVVGSHGWSGAGSEKRDGPIVVATDASAEAGAAVAPAMRLAAAYSVGLQLTRVVSREEGAAAGARSSAADHLAAQVASLAVDQVGQADHAPVTGRLLVANDHVAALVAEATARSSPFIALASHGDRTVARSTMSRTTSGLADEAPCPVLIAHPITDGHDPDRAGRC